MTTTTSRHSDSARNSYFLNITPVDLSLTDGTSIPPPTPPRTPVESPTPGGGPLSSHPPSTASTVATAKENQSSYHKDPAGRDRADSFRSAVSHISATQTAPASSPRDGRGPGLRKLLSLNNLRSSFSASRTSLLLPRSSMQVDSVTGMKRPSSPGAESTARAPSFMSRHRRSTSSWFKRRSSLFMLQNGDDTDSLDEQGRESKRRREYHAPPRLPQINELGGGMTDGDLGWDDKIFSK